MTRRILQGDRPRSVASIWRTSRRGASPWSRRSARSRYPRVPRRPARDRNAVLAGAINALKLTGRKPVQMKLVVSGAGAARVACTRTLKDFGFSHVVVCDTQGAIFQGWISEATRRRNGSRPTRTPSGSGEP